MPLAHVAESEEGRDDHERRQDHEKPGHGLTPFHLSEEWPKGKLVCRD